MTDDPFRWEGKTGERFLKMADASVSKLIIEIESYFSIINDRYYAGQLQKPVITVSPDTKNRAFDWCTSWKAWKQESNDGAEGYYEINICADYLNRPFIEVIGTLMHEMVHLWNIQTGVKDTSRAGTYHNGKFKEAAEAHGLILTKDSKYGWIGRDLNPEAEAFINSIKKSDFLLSRPKEGYVSNSQENTTSENSEEKPKRKHSSRKYVCPECGMIVRATKDVRILCVDCNKELVKA